MQPLLVMQTIQAVAKPLLLQAHMVLHIVQTAPRPDVACQPQKDPSSPVKPPHPLAGGHLYSRVTDWMDA